MRIKHFLNKLKFTAKKNSPELLIFGGIGTLIFGAVDACVVTYKKAPELIEEHKKNLESIQTVRENDGIADENVQFTEKEMKAMERKENFHFFGRMVWAYKIPIALGMIGTGCILGGHRIIKKRYIRKAAECATLFEGFKEYRNRVKERVGEDVEREIMYNLQPHEEDCEYVDENGKKKKGKQTLYSTDKVTCSDFAKYFDSTCNGWIEGSPENSLVFLKQAERHWNDKLHQRGFVFVNEIYEYLGIPVTKKGKDWGWIDDGTEYKISFGIFNSHSEANRRFVNGLEDVVLLEFNVDGDISELFTKWEK